jgi:hypothetical protein
MSLMVLPNEVQINIAGHLAATSERPMDDLRSLWVTCLSMHRICDDPAIAWRMAVDQCRPSLSNDCVNYFTLLARLTQFGNLEGCLLIRIQTVLAENHSPGLASTISPMSPMTGTIWWPIWLPYSFIHTMAMLATTTL